jgi:transcriptional regulator NrdR family protein
VKCPKCRSETIVLKLKTMRNGVVWRRRVCDRGHRFSTHELEEGKEMLHRISPMRGLRRPLVIRGK